MPIRSETRPSVRPRLWTRLFFSRRWESGAVYHGIARPWRHSRDRRHLRPDLPPLEYERDLFYEREIRSVTANTRADGEEFLKIAGEIPIKTSTVAMPLDEANRALAMLKHDELRGAAVLHVA